MLPSIILPFQMLRLCFVASGIWPWFLQTQPWAPSPSTVPLTMPLGSVRALDPVHLLMMPVTLSPPQPSSLSSQPLPPASSQASVHALMSERHIHPNPSYPHLTVRNGSFNLPSAQLKILRGPLISLFLTPHFELASKSCEISCHYMSQSDPVITLMEHMQIYAHFISCLDLRDILLQVPPASTLATRKVV